MRLEAEVRARLFGGGSPRARIGPYEVVRRLGQGGMGTVYLARHDGRLLAVKTSTQQGDAALGRLRREARALRTLEHPHIVRIEDAGSYDQGVYVAMEYVDGPCVREYLRGMTRWRDVARIFSQIADALACAHDLGIVHRDVKPDNIVLDLDRTAKLVDFGLAKALPGTAAHEYATLADPLTQTGAPLGTVGYAAPEQLLGRELDGRADQFGLCASVYEMFWGRLPFSGATDDAIGLATIAGKIDPPPADTPVPAAIVSGVLRGLACDPADRHPNIRVLARLLRP